MTGDLRRLTGRQRYWQAVKKARLATEREARRLGYTTKATVDRERDNIIAEFDRMQREIDRAREVSP